MLDPSFISELYRKEFSKIVTVLCSRFGMDFMDTALDIVSDTFLSAAETWRLKGVPDNPTGWLYITSKNKALNLLEHERVFEKKVKKALSGGVDPERDPDIDLSPKGITDSQLQMMFAICHPAIPVEAQISLALRILCGFTIDEIAQALLTTRANVNKRLFRAKTKLREVNAPIAFPDPGEINVRLNTVLITLYLLFNEGYYSASSDKVLRKDFCGEALRLAYLLAEHRDTASPSVFALMALMCYQASRFDARINQSGELVLYDDQDSSLWDEDLIKQGNYFFFQAFGKKDISRYHLEAAIAWWHTHQADTEEKWENILRLYNQLLILEYSPIAALNRTFAYAKVFGKEKAINEAESLPLAGNLFYHSLLADLYTGIDSRQARTHLRKALELTKVSSERAVLSARLSAISGDEQIGSEPRL
jgi:RNA polymerase sigma factor (sigma-70 family)